MIIRSTSLVVGAGVALTSDDQLITAMVRPIGFPCGGDYHVVSDKMRHSASVREAIALGLITVEMDGADSSDFVAQVELNALASSFSGFSGTVSVEKCVFLDIHGAEDTAEIRDINGTPYLVFHDGVTNKAIWTISVPNDYVTGSDMIVDVFWSPSTSAGGNVDWILEYKVTEEGVVVSSSSSTSNLIQAAAAMSTLQKTGSGLVVPSGAIKAGSLVTLGVTRRGGSLGDTFAGKAQVHHAKLKYTGSTAAAIGSGIIDDSKFVSLDIHGAEDTAEIRDINGTPFLVFHDGVVNKAIWTTSVPADYVVGTDIILDVYWSPSTAGSGDVSWTLKYKVSAEGTTVATATSSSSLIQTSPGAISILQRTGTSLVIPASEVTPGALLSLGVTRNGTDAADTFGGKAQVHHAKLRYSGITASNSASGIPGTKFLNLDFHGAADTSHIKVVDDVPYLEFSHNANSKSVWIVTTPDDYQSGTDVFVEIYWSPNTIDIGNIRWFLEYKVVAPGLTLSGASASSSLTQATSGTAFLLQTTGTSLVIPAASMSANAMLSLSVSRLGTNISDTYDNKARIHVVRVRYTGLKFS